MTERSSPDLSNLIAAELSANDNDKLMRTPVEDELKLALFSIPKDSSPGLTVLASDLHSLLGICQG